MIISSFILYNNLFFGICIKTISYPFFIGSKNNSSILKFQIYFIACRNELTATIKRSIYLFRNLFILLAFKAWG